MLRFLVGKFLHVIIVLTGVTLITFALVHAIPGTPWSNYSGKMRAMQGVALDKNVQRELDRQFGLDQPLWRQFTRYIFGRYDTDGKFSCGVICGNLGPSIMQRGRSVQDVLFGSPEGKTGWESRFGYSIRLVLLGSIFAIGLGVPLGFKIGGNPKSVLNRSISVVLAAIISVPNFILGLLAIVCLASWLKIIKVLPDWNNPGEWIVPAVVLAIMPMANIARVTRASLVNIVNEEYIRVARAKGLSNSYVMWVHVFRNALLPIITYMGPTLIELFTGLVIIENLYSFPGFGREYCNAVIALDYTMILGLTIIFAVGIILTNIVIDIVCEVIDPRIRSMEYWNAQ